MCIFSSSTLRVFTFIIVIHKDLHKILIDSDRNRGKKVEKIFRERCTAADDKWPHEITNFSSFFQSTKWLCEKKFFIFLRKNYLSFVSITLCDMIPRSIPKWFFFVFFTIFERKFSLFFSKHINRILIIFFKTVNLFLAL